MILQMDGEHPTPHRMERVLTFLKDDGVIALPTDTTYALACLPNNKTAVDKMRALRRLDPKKNLSLVFSDFSQLSQYALVDNETYRILKEFLPGPVTFILEASRNLPRLIGDKRKRFGVRMPKSPFITALVEALQTPLAVTSAIDPETGDVANDPWTVEEFFGHGLAAVVDAGDVPGEFSSVVDLSNGEPQVLREGLGDVSALM